MAPELLPALVSYETSLMEELCLVNRYVFGAALCWVGATVAHSDAPKVDSVDVCLFIEIQDCPSQGGDIDAGVTLASDVEVVLFEAWEFDEEEPKSQEIFMGSCCVIGN